MKKEYIRAIIIAFALVLLLFVINGIVSRIITAKINKLVINNSFKLQTISIENVKFNIFDRSVVANNLFLTPKLKSINELKKEDLKDNSLEKIVISSIAFKGISLLKILLFSDIKIEEIYVKDILIQNFKNNKQIQKKKSKKALNLDSLHIEKIKGLTIGKIKLQNFHYQEIDINSKKILMEVKPINLEINGFALKNLSEEIFKLKTFKNRIEVDDIEISIPKTGYQFEVKTVILNFDKSLINLKNIKYKPINNRDSLALSYAFNKEVYDVTITRGVIYKFQLKKLLNNGGLFIDSIKVTGMDLHIYKDKRKPFDKEKRPGIPHLKLRNMNMPMYIQNVKIDSTIIVYEERLEDKNKYRLMKLSLNQTNAQIKNITSIKKYRENPLEMHINSRFMNKADLDVKITFPLKDHHDTFYFNGSLGSSDFLDFESVIYPALGMKVSKGHLDGLTFSASADSEESKGNMTMLYHGLKAKVIKSNTHEKNKFLSWIVKEVTYKSNPRNGKHPKEMYMHTKRVEYKGFINYIWKTLQNGIIGTITPFGTTTEKERKKEERQKKHKKAG